VEPPVVRPGGAHRGGEEQQQRSEERNPEKTGGESVCICWEDEACATDLSGPQVIETWRFLSQRRIE
jgi:hypothetical protein